MVIGLLTKICCVEKVTQPNKRILEHVQNPGTERSRVRNAVPLGPVKLFGSRDSLQGRQRLARRVDRLECQFDECAALFVIGYDRVSAQPEMATKGAEPQRNRLDSINKALCIDDIVLLFCCEGLDVGAAQ